jgi:CDP-paratose 2-epimerase
VSVALITGGAGFVGSNLAHRLLSLGHRVRLLDDLSRPGVEHNARWLGRLFGDRVELVVGDVRDPATVRAAVADADQVFHLAAQVAVTTSLTDPLTDFEVNARGTLNVLEAVRQRRDPPPMVLSSTNKVYGALPDVPLEKTGDRYVPSDPALRARGVSEERPLDFHSPYGCSKGCADQYVIDHARTFGLPACVFRMSCIYGPRQFGTEDQGWVAHFLRRAVNGEEITIYGDGCQVRDVLFIEDLVDAFLLARDHMADVAGRAFNVGGGPESTLSLRELLDALGGMCGRRVAVRYADWRVGDPRYYVSDTRRFRLTTGWRPRVGVAEGLLRLRDWIEIAPRDEEAAAFQGNG